MMTGKRMQRVQVIFLSIVACWLFLASGIASAQGPSWETGDCWKVGVTLYSQRWLVHSEDIEAEARKDAPEVLNRCLVDVRVAGIDIVDDTECWRVEYVPDPNSHAVLREERYVVWVSMDDGQIRRARRVGGGKTKPRELLVRRIGGIPIVEISGLGFPLELVYPGAYKALGARDRKTKSGLVVDVSVLPESGATQIGWGIGRGVEEYRINQLWPAGSQWWSKWERYNQGHLVMKASTVGPWLATEFGLLHQEWRDLSNKGESERASAKYAQMEGIGIAVIPYMIEKIEDGETALVPAVAELLRGQLGDHVSRADVLDWWEINKNRWLAPFPPREPDEGAEN